MEDLTRVRFTNLHKVLYPSLGLTKSQVIEYYIKVAPRMLRFLARRAIVTNRFPDGINRKGFYGKDAPPGTPSWVETFKRYSKTAKRARNYGKNCRKKKKIKI